MAWPSAGRWVRAGIVARAH